jgi:hypothetical protein
MLVVLAFAPYEDKDAWYCATRFPLYVIYQDDLQPSAGSLSFSTLYCCILNGVRLSCFAQVTGTLAIWRLRT